jgi:hypothetical protein
MEELSKPKLERYNSEIINKNLKIAIENSKSNKRDEVIRIKSNFRLDEDSASHTENFVK